MNAYFDHEKNTIAVIVLDDNTKCHLRKEAGHVRIRINKDENFKAAYFQVRSMREGMEEVFVE